MSVFQNQQEHEIKLTKSGALNVSMCHKLVNVLTSLTSCFEIRCPKESNNKKRKKNKKNSWNQRFHKIRKQLTKQLSTTKSRPKQKHKQLKAEQIRNHGTKIQNENSRYSAMRSSLPAIFECFYISWPAYSQIISARLSVQTTPFAATLESKGSQHGRKGTETRLRPSTGSRGWNPCRCLIQSQFLELWIFKVAPTSRCAQGPLGLRVPDWLLRQAIGCLFSAALARGLTPDGC